MNLKSQIFLEIGRRLALSRKLLSQFLTWRIWWVKLVSPDLKAKSSSSTPSANRQKNRQQALNELAAQCDTVVVVGGNNSNNTRQLANRASDLGAVAFQVETADDLKLAWFAESQHVGVTAGTSTLEETVQEVVAQLEEFTKEKRRLMLFDSLKAIA